MIQRIQSIFLLISAMLLTTFLFIDIWQGTSPETNQTVTLSSILLKNKIGDITTSTYTFPLALLAIGSVIVSFLSIFSFNNRLKQMKLGMINSIVIAAILGLTIYYMKQGQALLPTNAVGKINFGMFLPTAAVICNMIANRFIKKDDDVVRSADRIR